MPHATLAAPRGDTLDLDLAPAALAMVWSGIGRPHEALAVPDIRLAPGDALVAVELATICGSDVHTVAGHRPGPSPSVLGHEQVGRVLATAGPVRAVDGRRLEPGMRVVWSVVVSCGRCARCRRGLPNKCVSAAKYGHEAVRHEWELSGGFASAVHLKRGTGIVIVDDATPAGVLAPASCATATVVAAIEAAEQSAPLSGRTVLVTGAGMLGLTATAMAADAGARVVVSDPSAERRAAALRFGAAAVADPALPSGAAGSLGRVLAAQTRGRGLCDVALELSGAAPAVASALAALDTGGVLVLVGSVSPGAPVPIDPERLVRQLLTVRGVHNYTPAQLQRAADYLADAWRRHPFEQLLGEVFPLEQIDEAFDAAARLGGVTPAPGSRPSGIAGVAAARIGLAPSRLPHAVPTPHPARDRTGRLIPPPQFR
ncbi:zinc-binding dehydrogenase [Microterricola viridarii]|uniref:zinc-binding dehydrogenase n=1 Tax=Microterricola viridarii TaxID=412690 RepID=UPI0009EAD42B|nr:zinc-binding dehydrogenase [Microterricola viridarii]